LQHRDDVRRSIGLAKKKQKHKVLIKPECAMHRLTLLVIAASISDTQVSLPYVKTGRRVPRVPLDLSVF